MDESSVINEGQAKTHTTVLVDHPPFPRPERPQSSFHLNEEQVRFFDENGYLILKNWISGDLLGRLQEAGDKWITQGESIRQKQLAGEPLTEQEEDLARDLNFARRSEGEVFFRVNYLHNKGEDISLELLGSPQVLGVAESLCGPNFVPTYESMVFKKAGDGESIPWHQDAVHTRKHRVFNFDLYLDDSKKGAGALRVVPGSQLKIQDACDIALEHGWDLPGVIHVQLEPGDVLLHDVMVLHGSERTLGKNLRRTIYYEFRAAEMILDEGPWDEDWIDKRLRLIPLALKKHMTNQADSKQFEWRVADTFRPEPVGDDELELKIAHIWHMAGSYCSATSNVYEEAMAKLEAV